MDGTVHIGRDDLGGPIPRARLLSNGRYTALLGAAGTGYSACDGCALTRWNADRIEDADGFFIFLRDPARGLAWSAGHQPIQRTPDRYEVLFRPGRVTLARSDDGIDTTMDVVVDPEADLEVRRVTLRNRTDHRRQIELTSYAEIVLADARADAAHPAFSKLFVQTERVRLSGDATGPGAVDDVLLARRRPRSPDEIPRWLVHAAHGGEPSGCETDRARFIGRGRTVMEPLALATTGPLSGTVGSVLDPIVSVRRIIDIEAGGTEEVTFVLGVAGSRDAALHLGRRTASPHAAGHAIDRAVAAERGLLEELGLSLEQATRFQDLATAVLYGCPRPCPGPSTPAAPSRPPGHLHPGAYGLDPGVPFIVAHVHPMHDGQLLEDLLAAQRYWRTKSLRVDLLVFHEGARAPAIAALAAQEPGHETSGPRVVVRRRPDIDESHLVPLQAMARVVLEHQWPTAEVAQGSTPAASFTLRDTPAAGAETGPVPEDVPSDFTEPLRFHNGHGGFTVDGREYVIRLLPDAAAGLRRPPMPWINVIANETFGCLASEGGGGYTWSGNSREYRLTPWYNDPVSDPYGEALYVRDETTGVFWSPLPGPVTPQATHEVRHGFGYSRYRHVSHAIEHEALVFVPRHDPVKITRLRLTNRTDEPRRLSLFAYQRLVLGELPAPCTGSVLTAFDTATKTLLARNPSSADFGSTLAFSAVAAPAGSGPVHFTTSRASFIGRNGSPRQPVALCRAASLDGCTGGGLDPCFALQVAIELGPRATVELSFLLGAGSSEDAVRARVTDYTAPGAVDEAFETVCQFWKRMLAAVHVETPSPAIDLLVNGWLGYQTLSCRLWGRSAFYQSGGAFGFRDQLQDAAALVYLDPDLTREQILLHAAHQFVDGDVLHWWHPPASRGLRTRFSDDLLWLPYVTAFYLQTVGDESILRERRPFLSARELLPDEDEAYLAPQESGETGDLYEHCCRALDRSLTAGSHGLPLMGTGDWNDGMNRVGRGGKGESVWLGFFLHAILDAFIPLCQARADRDRAARYRTYREHLREVLDAAGWDGSWYRRAYYDDGTPLGSAGSEECQIDALAQAWAVMSGAGSPERAARAMDAVERRLVSERDGVVRLLAPPFDTTRHDPGYIKGYVPGIRENGGQYTHAALWVVRALAELGRTDRAAPILAMLSPVSHTGSAADVARYQVEPYVVAADVYGVDPHIGRGGWTWYTGSAAWFLRVALESALGLRCIAGSTLVLQPCIPSDWPEYRLRYRLPDGRAEYDVHVSNPDRTPTAVVAATCDGEPIAIVDGAARLSIHDDGAAHHVHVTLGAATRPHPVPPRSYQ